MLRTCVQRFDVTRNLENFCKILGIKQALCLSLLLDRLCKYCTMYILIYMLIIITGHTVYHVHTSRLLVALEEAVYPQARFRYSQLRRSCLSMTD